MRRVPRSGVWVGAALLALALGCGESRRPTSSHAGGSAGTGGAAVAGSAGQPAVVVMQPSFLDSCGGLVPSVPLNRWSTLDLDQALDGWFGPGEKLAAAASPDIDYHRDVSHYFVSALLHVAQQRVKAVVADDATFELCDDTASEAPGCAQTFLREWGARLYRQPLTNEQLEAYVAQFRSAQRDRSPAEAARNALVSMVLSPYVVLRVELGDSKVAGRLAAHEIAARLSHFGARRPPDAQLLANATANGLLDADARKAELRRIWSSPQGQLGRVLTHLEWFGIRPDNERLDLDAELRADMATQVSMLVHDLLQSPAPTLVSLLTWAREPLNQRLAAHYMVQSPAGDGFQRVDLDPTLFAGVLSTGAFLSRYQRPTARGIQVLHALLCTDVPPPPGVQIPLPEGGTPRERITAAIGQDQRCTGCHQLMDPVGFALEAFDDQGRITHLDSSGALPSTLRVDAWKVANPGQLGATIALSDQGRACAARRYLEFALDRKVTGTSNALEIRRPDSPPGAPPIPTPSDPDERWINCLLQVSNSPNDFDFTRVGEAIAASNLMLTRSAPSQRVVVFDTSVDPVEHAAQETRQFRGVFSDLDDDALIRSYEQGLRSWLAAQESGNGGAGGESSGGAAGAGGAP